jgi:hypothetical protein
MRPGAPRSCPSIETRGIGIAYFLDAVPEAWSAEERHGVTATHGGQQTGWRH